MKQELWKKQKQNDTMLIKVMQVLIMLKFLLLLVMNYSLKTLKRIIKRIIDGIKMV